MIIQRLFSSKEQKARRRKWDMDQAMKQGEQTEAVSQAKMLGKDKTNELLNKYTKNTKTGLEGGIEFDGKRFLADKVTRTTVKNKKELDEMERARKLVQEGRKKSRAKNKAWYEGNKNYNVNDHINDKADEVLGQSHKRKINYERALEKKISEKEAAKSKEQVGKFIKKAGKGALIAGGVVAAGIGAKKLADKKKAEKKKK